MEHSQGWAYSQDDLQTLMAEFRRHDVPLSVCIIDMDWHITETGNASNGWTGYTWNRALFPDPAGFLAWLHAQGLKSSLNLHPAMGVWPHEEPYAAMARRLGVDPASEEPIPFDLADPAFTAAYFELLHHPQEAIGVDFWWIDWQQGALSKLPGLDPLWWLNHLHFLDLGRGAEGEMGGAEGNLEGRRPVVFSRWGGLGNHRYPIGFSGDAVMSWESLAFQPKFTATAANVGYGWWSHDIGGHMGGVEDQELYTRWVQYGVFSPILRLHSTKNAYHERRPWGWDDAIYRVTRDAMQLRHALIPYLYSMAWRAAAQALPLCLPMYWLHPEEDTAYACPNQYYFGSELVAAPFVAPAETDTGLSRQVVWLPEGDWFDFFSGEHRVGGAWRTIYGGLGDIPVFAKAGAIIPMGLLAGWGGIDNPADLTIMIFPGADNTFELFEDDGETTAYQAGRFGLTRLRQTWGEKRLDFAIAPVAGDASLIPAERRLTLVVRGIRQPDAVDVQIDGRPAPVRSTYDPATETLTIGGCVLRPDSALQLALHSAAASLLAPRDRRMETARKLLRAFRLDSWVKQDIDRRLPDLLADPRLLPRFGRDVTDGQLAALQNVISPIP
jgi:alpha-glucosidase (family GH31 glycosyl hydrolase)